MSGFLKAVNPFLSRIPRELHEQYMTDFVTEIMETKTAETNITVTDDGVILIKYGIIVAFVRKAWTLQPSIRCSHLQDYMYKYDRSRKLGWQQYTQTTHAHTNTKLCTLLLRWKRKTTCIHQTMYWIIREYLFVYIFNSYYYSHTSSNWYRWGWVGYGRHCICRGLHFSWKINYIIITGFFIYQSTVLAIKRVEIVSDRMSHIVMRGCRWDLVMIVHAPTANINYDSKENIYEEFEQVFDHFPTYHMQIFLGCCKAKYGREDRFKPTAGNRHTVWIHQTL